MHDQAPILESARLGDKGVVFCWSDGLSAEFSRSWLLDNADPTEASLGGHRARSLKELHEAGPIEAVAIEGGRVDLTLAGQTVRCAASRLRTFVQPVMPHRESANLVLWRQAEEIAGRRAIASAAFLGNDRALQQILSDVRRYGLATLSDAGEARGTLEKVVQRFGFIRETNYGRLFEVRVLTQPDHLAYTSQALEPHTDNPYRDPAPTLQLLHCVRNASLSGVTYFVDAFALAMDLRQDHPEDFARLSRYAAPFAYTAANGDHFFARSPIIRLDTEGEVSGVRFNHRALGAVDLAPPETALWYDSYLRFAQTADDPQRRYSLMMQPGDIVLFDNERLLHGRTEITGPADRLLLGCYAERDGLLATLARLEG